MSMRHDATSPRFPRLRGEKASRVIASGSKWALAIVAACVLAVAAPRSLAEPPKPAGPFDKQAEAGQDIAAALKKAKRNNTRVLIEWGGNTYPKSLAFHDLITHDRKISKVILYEYEHVLADYGQPMGKNVPLSKQFNAEVNHDGVPYLTVLDSDGRMFANQPMATYETTSVGGKPEWNTDAILKFLGANMTPRVAATTELEKGLADAKRDGRRVFLHFGAPWCPWCHRLDDWIDRSDVATLLAKDFVCVKIDTERNPGGQSMLDRFAGGEGKSGGIPWYVILDSDGKPIADSFAKPGADNIGFPAAADEIAAFGAMLTKGAKAMTAEDREKLLATLREKPAATEGEH